MTLWKTARRIRKPVVLVMSLACLCVMEGIAQRSTKRNEVVDQTSLRLVVTSSTVRLAQSDPLNLEVKLVNVGSEKVSIFGRLLWGYAGGLTIHVSDESGRPVEAEQHDDDMVSPSLLGNPDSYVVLLPDHFLGVDRKDSPRNLFRKPGSYSLFIEYLSPIPERYSKTPNFWGREKGVVRSAPIHIQVTGQ
jgi:uncharacterized protein YcfL